MFVSHQRAIHARINTPISYSLQLSQSGICWRQRPQKWTNKKPLTADSVSLAWRLDREMRRRLIVHETKQIYSLNVFYFLLYRLRYFLIQKPRFQRNNIIARYRKSDLHGMSFQSSPKINRMLIPRLICKQWKFTTPDHRNFANSDSYFFFDQSVVFTCSKVINAFKR